ncbi:hypothetical protein BT69DRAFT_1297750 [Atractiella rhizophila]|nr:hypothetical protein BT69DRAFT_1297750 [Atractiella rhizophila]
MQPTLLFSLLSLFLSSTVVAAGTHSPSGQDLQRFQIRHRPSAISLTKRQNDTDTTDATTDSSVDNTDSSDSSDSSTDSLVDGGNNKGIFDGLFGGGDDPIILIVVGSSIGGAFLIWTLIRKWRFSSSKRFQERMRPISFGPGEGADATPEFGGAVKRNDDSFNEKQGWNQIGDNPYGANVDGGHQQHQRGDSGDSHVTGYGRMNGAPQIPGASLNRQDSWGNRSGYGGYERSHTPAFERAVTPQPPAQQPYAAPQYPGPYGGPPMQVMPPMDPYAQDAQGLPYPGEFNQRMNARPPQPGFDPYYRGGNY